MVLMRALNGIAAAILMFSSASQAAEAGNRAEVHNRMGNVSINRGNGYVAVVGTTNGNPGDIVIAQPGGRGEIVYRDGCREVVEPGDRKTIAEESPCLSGYWVSHDRWGMALALGAGTGSAIYFATKDDDKPKSP